MKAAACILFGVLLVVGLLVRPVQPPVVTVIPEPEILDLHFDSRLDTEEFVCIPPPVYFANAEWKLTGPSGYVWTDFESERREICIARPGEYRLEITKDDKTVHVTRFRAVAKDIP